VSVSGADPLNLVGGLLAGDRVPRLAGARVLYRDGVPVAKRVGGEVVLIGADDPALHSIARTHLTRDAVRVPAPPAAAAGEEE
ncbi:MAG TPA: ATP-dependent DNA helicase, partial [Dokdonella sp.]